MRKECGGCQWFSRYPGAGTNIGEVSAPNCGVCVRFPPTIMMDSNRVCGQRMQTEFPSVHSSWDCGEFRERKVEETE